MDGPEAYLSRTQKGTMDKRIRCVIEIGKLILSWNAFQEMITSKYFESGTENTKCTTLESDKSKSPVVFRCVDRLKQLITCKDFQENLIKPKKSLKIDFDSFRFQPLPKTHPFVSTQESKVKRETKELDTKIQTFAFQPQNLVTYEKTLRPLDNSSDSMKLGKQKPVHFDKKDSSLQGPMEMKKLDYTYMHIAVNHLPVWKMGNVCWQVKIGKSNNIQKRIQNLNTGNSSEMVCYAHGIGGFELESVLLTHLNAHKLRGEWFLLTRELIQKVMSVLTIHEPIASKRSLQITPLWTYLNESEQTLLSNHPKVKTDDISLKRDPSEIPVPEKHRESFRIKNQGIVKQLDKLENEGEYGIAWVLHQCITKCCGLRECYETNVNTRRFCEQSRLIQHIDHLEHYIQEHFSSPIHNNNLLFIRYQNILKTARKCVGSEKSIQHILKCFHRNFSFPR